ncbi:hypothetical protein GCM10010452_58700 [Crossiella cryophila]
MVGGSVTAGGAAGDALGGADSTGGTTGVPWRAVRTPAATPLVAGAAVAVAVAVRPWAAAGVLDERPLGFPLLSAPGDR